MPASRREVAVGRSPRRRRASRGTAARARRASRRAARRSRAPSAQPVRRARAGRASRAGGAVRRHDQSCDLRAALLRQSVQPACQTFMPHLRPCSTRGELLEQAVLVDLAVDGELSASARRACRARRRGRASSTTISSASAIVDRRCAMISVVRPSHRLPQARAGSAPRSSRRPTRSRRRGSGSADRGRARARSRSAAAGRPRA